MHFAMGAAFPDSSWHRGDSRVGLSATASEAWGWPLHECLVHPARSIDNGYSTVRKFDHLTLYSMMHPHHLSRSTTPRLRQADSDAGTGNLDPLGRATTHHINDSEMKALIFIGVDLTPKAHQSAMVRPCSAPWTTRVLMMPAPPLQASVLGQLNNGNHFSNSTPWLHNIVCITLRPEFDAGRASL